MDVHKPKPIHGWREFLKEVGIIVLGVLIALGAEQAVARLHELRLADETRATARAELSAGLRNFINRRAIQACIDRRLDAVSGLLLAADKPGYVAPHWIGRPQEWGLVTSGWDAAAQGGRVALLTDKEQAELGGLYTRLRELYVDQNEEQKAWAELRQLEDQPRVDPAMKAAVRSALQQARFVNWEVRVDLEMAEQSAERLHIVKPPAGYSGSPSICLPPDTPRAQALAKIGAFFHDTLGEP